MVITPEILNIKLTFNILKIDINNLTNIDFHFEKNLFNDYEKTQILTNTRGDQYVSPKFMPLPLA
jgi:hypothetical protein